MASESEVTRDGTTIVMNATEVPTQDVMKRLTEVLDAPMAASLARWTERTQPRHRRRGTIADRDRFVTPDNTFAQIRMARDAMRDDVVGRVADTTESLVFSDVAFFSGSEDDDYEEQDVWNQWGADVDLDSRLREIWRQLWSDSQCVIGCWWSTASYKVRGKTALGNERRKQFRNLRVPTHITVFDTLKFAPVGNLHFGQERLAYIATQEEATRFDAILDARQRRRTGGFVSPEESELTDEMVERLIERRYDELDRSEDMRLQRDGVDTNNLFLCDEDAVFRHTLTKSGYQRFADVRMAGGVFELLDMKHQLRSKDRGFLLAGVNYLVVITKGSDDKPALPSELEALDYKMRTVAQLPFLIGDHRLNVSIVTPDFDATLNEEAWDTLDVRLEARLLQTFIAGRQGDDPLKLGKIIAEGLESRRKMIRRTLERQIVRRIMERNPVFTVRPKMLFTPEQISLSFDSAWASFILDLRDAGEISRETELSSFGFSQKDEAARLEREKKVYDDPVGPFKHQVPFSAPAKPSDPAAPATPAAKKSAGRRTGGTNSGGGAAPGSGQGKPARRVRRKSDGGKQ